MTDPAFKARSRNLLVSRIVVTVLALASSYYILFMITLMWGPSGYFGVTVDPATAIVTDVEPRDAAKGIRVGDRVDLAAMPFRERRYLYENNIEPVGIRMTLHLVRGDHSRAVTIDTVASHYSFDNKFATWAREVVTVLFIMTGVILVWNRPNVMLWGLAVFLIRTHDYVVGPLVSPGFAALLIFGSAFIYALGVPGLMVFASRFPDGRPNRATVFWNVAAAGAFIFYLIAYTHDDIPLFTARPIPAFPDLTYYLTPSWYVAIFVALYTKLRNTSRSARAGFGWIVAGYGIGVVVGRVALTIIFSVTSIGTRWAQFGQLVLMLALPASVAYSLIRHRAFALGYFTNRTMVLASLTIGIVFTFVIAVWVSSSRLSSSLGIGTGMFVALLLGMVLQAQRGCAIRFIDRIFLPHRYEAGVALDRICERLQGTNDSERVTGEVTVALGLASVAVFERAKDGGFVRNAACGWPHGTAWHLLPGDTVTRSLDEDGATIVALPYDIANDPDFPQAHARPRVALTIRRGGRIERAVFVGSYGNGASLDLDAIRSLQGVFDEVLVG